MIILLSRMMFETPTKAELHDLVQTKLQKGHEILPLPQVVVELLAALNDPDVSFQDVARIIESDAALSTRILRLANSPLYGFSNVIGSIQHATTILGIRPIRSVALTFAGASMFNGRSDASQTRELLWNHSLGVATLARHLALACEYPEPDDSFLVGIFHDVGKLFFFETVGEHYDDLVRRSGQELAQIELERFGVTHAGVGSRMTVGWQMHEQIVVAVGQHHQPEEAIAHQELSRMIYLANRLARNWGIGSTGEPDIDAVQLAQEQLELEEEELVAVRKSATSTYKQTRQYYS